jgi:hypothetical protein
MVAGKPQNRTFEKSKELTSRTKEYDWIKI